MTWAATVVHREGNHLGKRPQQLANLRLVRDEGHLAEEVDDRDPRSETGTRVQTQAIDTLAESPARRRP